MLRIDNLLKIYLLIDEEAAGKRKAVLRVDKLHLILQYLHIEEEAAGERKAVLRVDKLLIILPFLLMRKQQIIRRLY